MLSHPKPDRFEISDSRAIFLTEDELDDDKKEAKHRRGIVSIAQGPDSI